MSTDPKMEALLSNEFKIFFGFEESDSVIVTSDGMVKVNNSPFLRGVRSGQYLAWQLRSGKLVGIHRIIYAGFHPESIEQFRQGCRILYSHHLTRSETNVLRNYLEDLVLEPLSIRPERPLAVDSSGIHPVGYGTVVYGVGYPLMFKDKTNTIVPVVGYIIEFYDNYNTPCLVYRKDTGNLLRLSHEKITAKLHGKNTTMAIHVLALSSAFPNIDVSVCNTVDHINDDPTDHRITNLQWLTRSENSAKSSQPERGGRPIMMLKKEGDNFVEVCRFKSQYEAARLIKKYLPTAGSVKSIASKLARNNLHKPNHDPYNFFWRDVPLDIEGEEWKELPSFLGVEVGAYQVSNKGRVRNIFGYLFRPVPNRYGKYTSVSLLLRRNSQETKRFYVHFLVFCVFNNCLPSGDVRHNDNAPLTNGYYRNYFEDLIDGTRSQNMYEHNDAKRQRLLSRGVGPSEDEIYDIEDVMSEKASVVFDQNTFHERGWVFTDLEEEARLKYGGDEDDLARAINDIRVSKILRVRRDYPFHMNFYENKGGGCFYTSNAFTDGTKELKGPKNEGFDANVKILHMIFAYIKLKGDKAINFAELFEELAKEERQVKALDDLFQICTPNKGRNIINKLLRDSGKLPRPGFFVEAARANQFDIA